MHDFRPIGDNFIPVIPVDYTLHKETKPFCYEQTCSCHEDVASIAEVNQAVQEGLLTRDEATAIVQGKTI